MNRGTTNNQIILTGAVAARGETSNISTNIGMVTTPQRTFKVNLDKLNHAPGTGGINADTCSGALTVSGPITLFDGTGAYKGVSGTISSMRTPAGCTGGARAARHRVGVVAAWVWLRSTSLRRRVGYDRRP